MSHGPDCYDQYLALQDASQVGRVETFADMMDWYSKVTREDPEEVRKAEQIFMDKYKAQAPGGDPEGAELVATRHLLERHGDLFQVFLAFS